MEADRILPAEQARIDRARAVSSDLEAIFAGAVLPQAPSRRGGRVRSFARAHGSGLRLASLGAIAAAALAGLAAGAMMAPGKEPAAAPAPPQRTIEVVTNEPLPRAAAFDGYPWSPEPYAPMDLGIPARSAQASAPPAQPVITKAVTTTAKPRKPRGPCGGRCTRDEVMQADIRLRRAYFRAMDAGVPRATLASYRDRWSSLRRYGRREPERLVSGYAVLARDLSRAASRARRS